MKCQVLKSFVRRGENILPGSILEIPEEMIPKMAGYVLPLTHCQARKVLPGGGYRVCGAPLNEGINGHLSCSDMRCQVPATHSGLIRRGGVR
jgi:hypothetical protein